MKPKFKWVGLNVVCNNARVGSYTDERDRFDEVIAINLMSTIRF